MPTTGLRSNGQGSSTPFSTSIFPSKASVLTGWNRGADS